MKAAGGSTTSISSRPRRARTIATSFRPRTRGTISTPALDIREGDPIVFKNRFSPFVAGASNLDELLRARGIDSLIVAGTATNMCCESAARDAMMLDYKVVMVSDANGARYPEDHMAGLTSFYQSFGDVRTTNEVIGDLLA